MHQLLFRDTDGGRLEDEPINFGQKKSDGAVLIAFLSVFGCLFFQHHDDFAVGIENLEGVVGSFDFC